MKGDTTKLAAIILFIMLSLCPKPALSEEAAPRQEARQTLSAGKKAKISADEIRYEKSRATAYGNAVVHYKGAVIKADQIIYDEFNRTITLYGNVDLTKDGSNLKADYGVYGMDTGRSELYNASGYTDEVDKDGKKIDGKVYFWGDKIVRDEKETKIKNAVLTTCDNPRPDLHYHIQSENAVIIPGKKVIAYNSKLKINNRTLIKYKRLEFRLGKRQQGLIPTIGNNTNDGWYVKKNIPFTLFGFDGTANIDLYQKTGVGFGVKYPYSLFNGKAYGYLDYYNLSPSKTALITENLTDDQRNRTIGRKELKNNIRYEIGNGYYTGLDIGMYDHQYPGEKSSNWKNYNFYFGRNTKKQNLYIAQTCTDYNTYTYQTRKLEFAQRIGQGWTARIGGFNSGYAGNVDSTKEIWRYYTELNYENAFTDMTLSYIRSTNNEVYHLDKVPEFNMISKNLYLGDIPIRAAFTVGDYREEPAGLNMGREKIYIGIDPVSIKVGESGDLNLVGGYHQLFCGDGSSKYAFSAQANYTHELNKNLRVKANYYFQNPKGYSPFVDDYIPSYSMLMAGAEIHNEDYWKLSVYGGYDYMYDTKTSIITTLSMKPNEKMNWIIGSSYNPTEHSFSNFSSELKLDLGHGLSVENWMLYDTINDKLTYMNIGISKETHDFVTKLLYRNQQKEFWLQFYLKAFPEEPCYITPNPMDVISPRK